MGAQTTDEGDYVVDYPTLNETEVAVAKLKNNKAPGRDNLPAELLKLGDKTVNAHLHHPIRMVWIKEIMPEGALE